MCFLLTNTKISRNKRSFHWNTGGIRAMSIASEAVSWSVRRGDSPQGQRSQVHRVFIQNVKLPLKPFFLSKTVTRHTRRIVMALCIDGYHKCLFKTHIEGMVSKSCSNCKPVQKLRGVSGSLNRQILNKSWKFLIIYGSECTCESKSNAGFKLIPHYCCYFYFQARKREWLYYTSRKHSAVFTCHLTQKPFTLTV